MSTDPNVEPEAVQDDFDDQESDTEADDNDPDT